MRLSDNTSYEKELEVDVDPDNSGNGNVAILPLESQRIVLHLFWLSTSPQLQKMS